MTGQEFVEQLLQEMDELFAQLDTQETLESETSGQLDTVTLLRHALRSEVEAAEIAGLWMPTTPETDVKMAFARQCGDEMRHYELILERLQELGEDPDSLETVDPSYSPLYQYLRTLQSTVERIAAAPFAREAAAKVRNAQFVDFCRSIGDQETTDLYVDIIQPDEVHHHELGCKLLARYATSDSLQTLARAAARNSLAIADELRTLAEKTTGLRSIPVS